MKLASFDIEIATPIPENCKDWRTLGPLGISCAAIAFNDTGDIEIWQNPTRLTQQEAKDLVYYIKDLEKRVIPLLRGMDVNSGFLKKS